MLVPSSHSRRRLCLPPPRDQPQFHPTNHNRSIPPSVPWTRLLSIAKPSQPPQRQPPELFLLLARAAPGRGAPPCASFLPRSGSRGTPQPCPRTPASSPEQPATTSRQQQTRRHQLQQPSIGVVSCRSRREPWEPTGLAPLDLPPPARACCRHGPTEPRPPLLAPSPTGSHTQQVQSSLFRHVRSLSLPYAFVEKKTRRLLSICRTPLLQYHSNMHSRVG